MSKLVSQLEIEKFNKDGAVFLKNKFDIEWIEKLIVSYYDKMYDYQLNKKIDRCIFKGNRLECLEYLRS